MSNNSSQPPIVNTTHLLANTQQQKNRKEEFNETLNQCFTLIETSHQDISIIKVSIQSLVELNASTYCNLSSRIRIFNLFLDIIQSPLLYRKTVIRCAIKGLGTLACQDETLITQSITFLAKILEFQCENYQYMKRSCFHALSRIGRKYPIYQTILISLFEQYFLNTNSSKDDICSILLAFGRFSQTNSQIRVLSMKRWLESIDSPHYLFKSAGILSIGYASCPTGNIVNDKNIESICYSKSIELLQYHKLNDLKPGEEDTWKKEEVYVVQMAACRALGLLVRSNPNEWLPRLQKIFKVVLSSIRYSGFVKSVVLQIYGQLTYDLPITSPFFTPIKVLLFELSNEDNISISSPSFYSLVKFALSHESNYNEVYEMLRLKLNNNSPNIGTAGAGLIKQAKPEQLVHFLKTWSKLISRSYRPMINQCSSIISPFYSDLYEPNSPLANQLVLYKKRTIAKNQTHSNIFQNQSFDNPFQNYQNLVMICSCFSPLVLSSILALFKKPQLLNHVQFKKALKEKIKNQKTNGFQLDPFIQLEAAYQIILKELTQDPTKRESFILLLNNPENLDSKDFQENLKSSYEKGDSNKVQPTSADYKPSDPRLKKNPFLKPLPLITENKPQPQEIKEIPQEIKREEKERVEKERVEKERVEKERVEKDKPQQIKSEEKEEKKKKIFSALPLMKPTIPIYELPKVIQPIRNTKISNTQQNLGMKLMGTTSIPVKKNPFLTPLPLITENMNGNSTSSIQQDSILSDNSLNSSKDESQDEDSHFEPFQIDIDNYSKEIEMDQDEKPPILDIDNSNNDEELQENDQEDDSDEKDDDSDSESSFDSEENELTIDDDSNDTPMSTITTTKKRPNSLLELEEDDTHLSKKICLENNSVDSSITIDFPNSLLQPLTKKNKKERGKKREKKRENRKNQEEKKKSKSKNNNQQRVALYAGIDFNAKTSKPKVICSFYKLGICTKGEECTFLHEGPIERKPLDICKFFKTGSCMKGEECTYSHDLKSEPCKFFNSPTGCTNTDCQYGHFVAPVSPILNSQKMENSNDTQQPFNSITFQ